MVVSVAVTKFAGETRILIGSRVDTDLLTGCEGETGRICQRIAAGCSVREEAEDRLDVALLKTDAALSRQNARMRR